jgi:hypothetical protein
MSYASTQTNGLGYDTIPSSTSVVTMQQKRFWCLWGSRRLAVAKFDEVWGRKKFSIDIRPKRIGKDVNVFESSHRLPSVLARYVERAQQTVIKSPMPLELKATSRSRSTSNRFASCTFGTRCAKSANIYDTHKSYTPPQKAGHALC